ncbi:carbohydrate ABC transporter permease [Deinococcus pimensis]|uniref:carbohydrate ABC transporter permease n=1 Tax=Deinococcus pimensis TaxID=309888 RepID=UPI0004AF00D5|nr:sugar ABC transporter permease [Deinococcus pimensis]
MTTHANKPTAATRPRDGFGRRVTRAAWSYVLLAPAVALVALFVIYPLIASYPYTLYHWNGVGTPDQYVGLRNFTDVARDPFFWSAFKHTFAYVAMVVPLQLLLSLILALVLNNPALRGRNLYRALYFTPAVTSTLVVGIVLSFIFTSLGQPVSEFLQSVGVLRRGEVINILADPRFALPAIAIVGVWHGMGYNLIYFLAALQSIPKELYEAARIDGATSVQEFWRITIPMLRAPGMIILFLTLTGALGVFELVVALSGVGATGLLAGTEVVSTYIYRNAFSATDANVGFASAAALFMGFLTIGISLLQLLVFRRLGIRRPGLTDTQEERA